ncbi:CocE/NonD family hydrolase [Cryobacterium sp. PH31-O1]|uniref:CocE/NonD family hydrolase n=1 Tax=Cryobacterium sp. PH31-O1 TaxID=3046306 RepID=UPI0024BA5C14|nr:CocE/NonD family hydrolase [Cryobacterium sp. PH31-O1]MDJ0338726.1 CocE/NonD family hydrolase [Cryobacterium sp. PH31-O1]
MPVTDGVELEGILATAVNSRGTVIIRTPYNCEIHAAQALSWQARGYSCVIADVRGRYTSGGRWHPYSDEGADGAATVREVLAAPWHRGGITLLGASYTAHCAVETARALTSEPHLAAQVSGVVALVPALGRYETARDPNGCPRLADRLGWWFEHGFARRSGPPLDKVRAAALLAHARHAGPEAAHPLPEPTPEETALWSELWVATPTDVQKRYARITTPLLVVTGTRDFFVREALDLHDSWPGQASLITGPWGHRLAVDPADPAGSIGDRVVAWMQRFDDASHISTPISARKP